MKQQKIFSNYLGWKQTKEFIAIIKDNKYRQLESMLEVGISERDIFVDKCSGKNFDRPQYQALKVQLREGDILVIKSIDRLGRNYKQICEEWREITREIKANIKVLDMPVLDTTRTEGLIGEVISDIVLQLLSYVAEQEHAFIKQRQAEGIKLAKEKGKRLGKPPIEYPENWDNVYKIWKSGTITAREAMKQLNLKPTSFYKLAKKYKNN
ncbi:MAG: recombinase family protein [Cyanobacteriota bacterium]|nr:recombinase family protein [Cyanobacteriota bacterium]MDY6364568.1 recombinase family protein [Cyanobacteriota bacterium]